MQRNDEASTLQSKRRSEVVTVRLDPRLKYLADVAARKQRRTLSGYIEWAVEQSLASVTLDGPLGDATANSKTVADADRVLRLWDVEEADRVLTLAFHFPELLNYDEQLIWRVIRDWGSVVAFRNRRLGRQHRRGEIGVDQDSSDLRDAQSEQQCQISVHQLWRIEPGQSCPNAQDDYVLHTYLRKHWATFKKVAANEWTDDKLPEWPDVVPQKELNDPVPGRLEPQKSQVPASDVETAEATGNG